MMTLVREQERVDSADQREPQPGGIERRRGLRIAQCRPVKVFEPTSARYIPGHTEDISATGLRVELPVSAPVLPGKLINVHVGLSSNGERLANRRQMIPAKVVWIDRGRTSGARTMTLGLEFLASISAQLDAA
jgi:hypothetical protein